MSSKSFLQKKVANISPGDLDILRPACHIQTIRCPGLAACFYVEVTSVFSSIGELLHPSADSCRQSFCALVLLDKAAFIGCCFQLTPLHSQSLSSGVYLEFLNNQSHLLLKNALSSPALEAWVWFSAACAPCGQAVTRASVTTAHIDIAQQNRYSQ
ncbi:hypothetical protein XENOCAPTIV_005212 [Xenoophorus captivus]|uniref:Uncharacterized protein n=1 Tax=Xenoophorus captivus TaxID=1517983 RepID=A0ABV0QQ23_9TELE